MIAFQHELGRALSYFTLYCRQILKKKLFLLNYRSCVQSKTVFFFIILSMNNYWLNYNYGTNFFDKTRHILTN